MVEELTKESIKKKISKDNNKPIIIDFYGDWCAPCKTFAPKFEKVSKEFDNIDFAKYDIDEDEKVLSIKLEIRSVPTIIIFNKGEEVDRIIGDVPEEELKEKMKEVLSKI